MGSGSENVDKKAIKSRSSLCLCGAAIILLMALQFLYTKATLSQVLYEELAESVRNVFWLQQRTIFDGGSSNIGWNGLLLIIYRLFGFSLFTAKYVRLALHLIGLLCLASLLRRWLGERRAIPALLAIGLSPVILYFNTLVTPNGLDFQYFVISLYLLFALTFRSGLKDLILHAALGAISMVACMSYPAFLFYLPSLGILYLWRWKQHNPGTGKLPSVVQITSGFAGMVMPMAIGFLYVRDRQLLIFDPVAQTGLFRGGGHLDWSWPTLYRGLSRALSDLFDEGYSYYFILPLPDFSGPMMLLSLTAAMIMVVLLAVRSRMFRLPLLLIAAHTALNLIFPNFADNAPGIRKCTGAVSGIYALYLLAYYGLYEQEGISKTIRRAGLICLLLLPLHHLYSYAVNLDGLSEPNPFAYGSWFAVKGDPRESFGYSLQMVDEGQAFFCAAEQTNRGECRYQEIYAAVAGYRLWNGLPETPVFAYDWNRNDIIPLSVDLWKSYYFPH